jgi:hypothetical protein
VISTDPVKAGTIPKLGSKLFHQLGILNFLVFVNQFEAFGYNIFNNQTFKITNRNLNEALSSRICMATPTKFYFTPNTQQSD